MKVLAGAGLALVLVLGGSTAAQASQPLPQPAWATATETVTSPAGVLTIKAKTAGTGTNFSGTYWFSDGTTLQPGEGVSVRLQRKTPTGWSTVTTDTADENGNLVYGTVHSNYVQTWRLVPNLATTAQGYGVSPSVRIAQHGRATSKVTFPTLGFREGKHVAFNGYYTYRSWWITSGPDKGKAGYAAPLSTRLYLQYWTGTTWRTKASAVTEDRNDRGVNLYIDVRTNYSTPSTWRWYYPGSTTRTSTTSPSLRR